MDTCDMCEEMGLKDCMNCWIGNPCLGCLDYDEHTQKCRSNGGCGEVVEDEKQESN